MVVSLKLHSVASIGAVRCISTSFYDVVRNCKAYGRASVCCMVNKKLRYREEHSASVVLRWCTLWHFLEDNQL